MRRILYLALSVFRLRSSTGAFVPLSCNNQFSQCIDWTQKFGDAASFSDRLSIQCGECVYMNQPNHALHLEGGLDVYGKLVIPNSISVEIWTPLLVVHGELIIHARKPVDGSPDIQIIMTEHPDKFFEPINENSSECNGRCLAGRKAIIVAGGKVTGTFLSHLP